MNLAAVLSAKRRARGITQEELAAHIGVSKASVSKWEKGNSLPDIAHLPTIASYFDITVDELVSYKPQLSDADIAKIYTRLAADFGTEPFEDVIAECEQLARKYYSCYPFVLYITLLYINHADMAPTPQRKTELLQSAIALCEHILQHCRDLKLLQEAKGYQALCHLVNGDGEQVLALLADANRFPAQHEDSQIVSQAHQLLGNMEKAAEVEQAALFQSLMGLLGGLTTYIKNCMNDYAAARPAYERAMQLVALFNVRKLNANVVGILHAIGAQMYQAAGETALAIATLEQYVEVCTRYFFPIEIRGDTFFDKIDYWLGQYVMNQPIPRSDAVIKASMLNDVLLIPAFESLHGNPAFDRLVNRLKHF